MASRGKGRKSERRGPVERGFDEPWGDKEEKEWNKWRQGYTDPSPAAYKRRMAREFAYWRKEAWASARRGEWESALKRRILVDYGESLVFGRAPTDDGFWRHAYDQVGMALCDEANHRVFLRDETDVFVSRMYRRPGSLKELCRAYGPLKLAPRRQSLRPRPPAGAARRAS